MAACWEMDLLWKWYDDEPELRVAIITGVGTKSLSAGMDLKDWQEENAKKYIPLGAHYPRSGFAGMTRRNGKKPIIAAVNGHAHGGGFEIALNSDLVLASPNANFRLPDVMRGTAAIEGSFPRMYASFGLQRAMQLALTAYTLKAEEAMSWGLVQKIVPNEELLGEAVKMASLIVGMSPDSVIVSRMGIRQAMETASVERTTQLNAEMFADRLMHGENVKEGMLAFQQKREPKWVPSKL